MQLPNHFHKLPDHFHDLLSLAMIFYLGKAAQLATCITWLPTK